MRVSDTGIQFTAKIGHERAYALQLARSIKPADLLQNGAQKRLLGLEVVRRRAKPALGRLQRPGLSALAPVS